jgi:uncharacterized protein (TIRG00374 family)
LKKKFLSALKILFFLSIGVFFIWIFLRKLTPDQKLEIWESFIHADFIWLLLALIIGLLSHLARTLRWLILLEPMGYKPRLSITFSAVMIGYLANMALPRLGEVTRCGVLNKYEKIPITKSIGTVIVERSVDIVVFILLFFINLFIFFDKINRYASDKIFDPLNAKFQVSDELSRYLLIAFAIIAAIIILFFLLKKRLKHTRSYIKMREIAQGFWHGLWAITRIRRPIAFVLYSVGIWVLYFLMVWVCVFSLPETAHLGIGAGLSMLIFGSIGIMIVQGGIGIYPAIIAEVLLLYNIPTTTGYALGWLTWTAQTLMIVVAGFASLIILPIIQKRTKYATSAEHSVQNIPTGE